MRRRSGQGGGMSPLITPRFTRRRPFALVAAASGILCLALIGCWVFSLFAPFGQAWDTSWGGNGDGYQMRVWVAERGSLHLLRHDEDRRPIVPSTPQRIYHWGYDPPGRLALQVGPTRLGFAFRNKVTVWKDPLGRRNQTVQDTNSQVSIPLWLPMLLFAL